MQTNMYQDNLHTAVKDIEEFLSDEKIVNNLVKTTVKAEPVPNSSHNKELRMDVELEVDVKAYEELGLEIPDQISMSNTYYPGFEDESDFRILYEEWSENLVAESSIEPTLREKTRSNYLN